MTTTMAERNVQMYRWHISGRTYSDIGREYEITPTRVREICMQIDRRIRRHLNEGLSADEAIAKYLSREWLQRAPPPPKSAVWVKQLAQLDERIRRHTLIGEQLKKKRAAIAGKIKAVSATE